MASSSTIDLDLLERIQRALGLTALQSDQDLLQCVEQRLPVRVLSALTRHGLSDDEIYRLVIPRRTLAHRKAKKEPLTQEESDRAVRLARITSLAEKVFADKDKALQWLHKPKKRFQGRMPIALLATESGARLVEEMLYQIDHGIFA